MNPLATATFAALRAYAKIAPTGRGTFHLARLARCTLPRSQWQDVFTGPDNLQFDLDLATYPDVSMSFGLYELDTTRLLHRLLRPGQWFVDCGANLGYFTLIAAKLVGAAGRVDAYEPSPLNRARLEQNLTRNHLSTPVHIRPVAVGDTPCTVLLHHPSDPAANHGMATLYPTAASATPIQVPLVRLDADLPGIPHLIKIDIEGAELPALRGLANILRSPTPPTLIIEHNPVTASAASHKPSDLARTLLELQPRYHLSQIARRLLPIPSPAALDNLPREINLLASI